MTPCERVHEFVDGELDKQAAEKFCDHLVDCLSCQTELEDALQLGWLTAELHSAELHSSETDEAFTEPSRDESPVAEVRTADADSGPAVGPG